MSRAVPVLAAAIAVLLVAGIVTLVLGPPGADDDVVEAPSPTPTVEPEPSPTPDILEPTPTPEPSPTPTTDPDGDAVVTDPDEDEPSPVGVLPDTGAGLAPGLLLIAAATGALALRRR